MERDAQQHRGLSARCHQSIGERLEDRPPRPRIKGAAIVSADRINPPRSRRGPLRKVLARLVVFVPVSVVVAVAVRERERDANLCSAPPVGRRRQRRRNRIFQLTGQIRAFVERTRAARRRLDHLSKANGENCRAAFVVVLGGEFRHSKCSPLLRPTRQLASRPLSV